MTQPTPTMKRRDARVSRLKVLSRLALLVVAVLALSADRAWLVALTMVLGPFAGGVARGWQPCCGEFSLLIAPYAIALALVAVVARFCFRPRTARGEQLQALAWVGGLTSWFAAAVLSYMHAFS